MRKPTIEPGAICCSGLIQAGALRSVGEASAIFEAEDLTTGRVCLLHEIAPPNPDPSLSRHFQMAVRRLRDLDDSPFVPLSFSFTEGNSCFFVEALPEGASLEEARQPLAPEDLSSAFRSILSALVAIHEADPPLFHGALSAGRVYPAPNRYGVVLAEQAYILRWLTGSTSDAVRGDLTAAAGIVRGLSGKGRDADPLSVLAMQATVAWILDSSVATPQAGVALRYFDDIARGVTCHRENTKEDAAKAWKSALERYSFAPLAQLLKPSAAAPGSAPAAPQAGPVAPKPAAAESTATPPGVAPLLNLSAAVQPEAPPRGATPASPSRSETRPPAAPVPPRIDTRKPASADVDARPAPAAGPTPAAPPPPAPSRPTPSVSAPKPSVPGPSKPVEAAKPAPPPPPPAPEKAVREPEPEPEPEPAPKAVEAPKAPPAASAAPPQAAPSQPSGKPQSQQTSPAPAPVAEPPAARKPEPVPSRPVPGGKPAQSLEAKVRSITSGMNPAAPPSTGPQSAGGGRPEQGGRRPEQGGGPKGKPGSAIAEARTAAPPVSAPEPTPIPALAPEPPAPEPPRANSKLAPPVAVPDRPVGSKPPAPEAAQEKTVENAPEKPAPASVESQRSRPGAQQKQTSITGKKGGPAQVEEPTKPGSDGKSRAEAPAPAAKPVESKPAEASASEAGGSYYDAEPEKSGSKLPMFIGIGLAAVAVIAVAVYFATRSSSTPQQAPAPAAVTKPAAPAGATGATQNAGSPQPATPPTKPSPVKEDTKAGQQAGVQTQPVQQPAAPKPAADPRAHLCDALKLQGAECQSSAWVSRCVASSWSGDQCVQERRKRLQACMDLGGTLDECAVKVK